MGLNQRITNRVQLTTDGLNHYTVSVPECLGIDVDFAQLTKMFGDYGQYDNPEGRYSPSPIKGVISKVRIGDPDRSRLHQFRRTAESNDENADAPIHSLTNAFSKKLSDLKAAVALHFAYYNFCRVHGSLRVTPAMEAGLASHVWSISELLGAA